MRWKPGSRIGESAGFAYSPYVRSPATSCARRRPGAGARLASEAGQKVPPPTRPLIHTIGARRGRLAGRRAQRGDRIRPLLSAGEEILSLRPGFLARQRDGQARQAALQKVELRTDGVGPLILSCEQALIEAADMAAPVVAARRRPVATAIPGKGRRRQHALDEIAVLVVAELFRPDWREAGDEDQLVGGGKLHHLARREQRPRRLLPADH